MDLFNRFTVQTLKPTQENKMTATPQRILIVGGSTGMGLAAAQRLARAGSEVIIVGRSRAKLDAALSTIDGRATACVADFTDAASLAALFEQVGRIDHLGLAASSNAAWGRVAGSGAETWKGGRDGKRIG